MALALSLVSGCASIADYQTNHPYYAFPGRVVVAAMAGDHAGRCHTSLAELRPF